ncbi:MAG TPA: DUF3604 domain-containing protein, partial [Chlamydiales bacterium]|nr:DUF3604 domain-containing protein [Chlamydiales bacterium]
MRRSICYTEPNNALAGQKGTWKFIYTTSIPLPKGTKIKFDLMSKGRTLDWAFPSVSLKDKSNLIWAEIKEQKVPFQEVVDPKTALVQYELTLPTDVKMGENINLFLGAADRNAEKGSSCQKNVQRRRPFHLFIDPKGKGDYKEPEVFYIDVRGNELSHLRIITPSIVMRNKRFDVIVRFEDVYGNLTNNAPEGTLIDLSYEHLRENLNWKLFVPETGFITLPNLYFNEPGVYKIQLRNLKNNQLFYSSPIKCLADSELNLFWGVLHGESERFDTKENIESALRYFRDEKALHFFGTSPFDSEEETSTDIWKTISSHVAEFNEDDRFSSLLGMQWAGEPKMEGSRIFVYGKDAKPILRRKDTKTNALKKIYKTIPSKELLSIPTFTMGKNSLYDFEDFTPEFERVVEIYNSWGSSECTAKEGNLRPIKGKGKNAITEDPTGSIQEALRKGFRFGFVAGGLDDRGIYEGFYDSDQVQYSPGLTAILAKEHSRASLLEALYNRSCYATTGARIILDFTIAGLNMGSELNNKAKPGLDFNRHIAGYV